MNNLEYINYILDSKDFRQHLNSSNFCSTLHIICVKAIINNNVKLIKILCDHYDLNLYIKNIILNVISLILQYPLNKVDLDTFIFLENNNIKLFDHMGNIFKIFCIGNNINNFEYYIMNGIDLTYALTNLSEIKCDMIREIFIFLIRMGIDLNKLNKNIYLELLEYEEKIHLPILKILVENGYNIREYAHDFLLCSIRKEYPDTILYILNFISDIHFDDDILLRFAVHKRNIYAVNLLLDHGANIHTDNLLRYINYNYNRDKFNTEGIRYYSSKYSEKYCKILLDLMILLMKNGAEISSPDITFKNLISKYATGESYTELFKIIFDIGIDFNDIDNIHYCVKYGTLDIIKLYMLYDADFNKYYYLILKTVFSDRNDEPEIINFIMSLGLESNLDRNLESDKEITELIYKYKNL